MTRVPSVPLCHNTPRPQEEASAPSLCRKEKEGGFVAVPEPTSSRLSCSPLFFDDFGSDSPTPSALSQSYTAQAATCPSTIATGKAVPKGVPKCQAAMLRAASKPLESAQDLGTPHPPAQGHLQHPQGCSEGMGRRWMAEPAALLWAAVCTAGVHQGP